MRSHHAPLLYIFKEVELRDYNPTRPRPIYHLFGGHVASLVPLRSVQLVTVLPVVLLALPIHYSPYSSSFNTPGTGHLNHVKEGLKGLAKHSSYPCLY